MFKFGLTTSNGARHFDELVSTLDAVRPTTAERIGLEAYHKDYGIFDHTRPVIPGLDVVTLHPKENIIEGGPRRSFTRKFLNFKVRENCGLTWTEFWDLPYHEALFMLEYAEFKILHTNSALTQLSNSVAAESRKK